MSSDIENRLNDLEDLILNRPDEIGKRTGIPFIIFPYPPTSGLGMLKRINSFIEKLEYNDKKVAEINMRELFFSILEERSLTTSVFEVEKNEEEDLSKALRPVFFEKFKDELGSLPQLIINKKENADVMIMYNLGILYPFSSLSNVLTNLENYIHIPLIAFYPAEEKIGKELRFLGETNGSYYRAKVI